MPPALEIEHLAYGTGDSVEGTVANPGSAQPVVFDKSDDRTLIGNGVIHEVTPGPGGDHQQRQPWSVTATAQCVGVSWVQPRQREG